MKNISKTLLEALLLLFVLHGCAPEETPLPEEPQAEIVPEPEAVVAVENTESTATNTEATATTESSVSNTENSSTDTSNTEASAGSSDTATETAESSIDPNSSNTTETTVDLNVESNTDTETIETTETSDAGSASNETTVSENEGGSSDTTDTPSETNATTPVQVEGPRVWDGATTTFSKANGADPTDASNQDRLTPNVWITRGNGGGQIFNAAVSSSADKTESPYGTEWAVGTLDQKDNLTYQNFRAAVNNKPKNVVGTDLVLHLIEDDIYLSIRFTSWSSGQGGGFSYERSTP